MISSISNDCLDGHSINAPLCFPAISDIVDAVANCIVKEADEIASPFDDDYTHSASKLVYVDEYGFDVDVDFSYGCKYDLGDYDHESYVDLTSVTVYCVKVSIADTPINEDVDLDMFPELEGQITAIVSTCLEGNDLLNDEIMACA